MCYHGDCTVMWYRSETTVKLELLRRGLVICGRDPIETGMLVHHVGAKAQFGPSSSEEAQVWLGLVVGCQRVRYSEKLVGVDPFSMLK